MNELGWDVALAVSSVIVGVASLWALFRPLAAGTARRAMDGLKQDLKRNEFHDIGVRFERLEVHVDNRVDQLDGRIDRLEARLDKRIDQLDVRLTAAISEVRTDLGRLHETQGRILEAIRALSPVGNQR